MDWRNPDYAPIFAARLERLRRIRERPDVLPALRLYYRDNPGQFISDWGCTTDPRNVEIGLPATVPFILFPRQVDWINWVMRSWKGRVPGVTPKSRESGVSWLALSLSSTLCLFNSGVAIGFGSRKEEYVDKIGAPKSLFWKARKFIELLPSEFRNGFDMKNDAPHMRLIFRATDSVITGEAGDNIGRGDRASIYFVDESDFLEHPELADAALSQTTNCRIDISTANGLGKPFHRKVTTWPAERVFRFHWRDDPRKDDAWYAKQCDELDPVTIAQEIDIDFAASVEGVLIPSAWVQSAIGAAEKLGIRPTGARAGAFDVADEGADLNAFAVAHGIEVQHVEEWRGKGDDIYGSTVRAFDIADTFGLDSFKFDSDGLGAGVRGDARVINEQREAARRKVVDVVPFRGSQGVFNPNGEDVRGRKNEDYFMNRKAQAWWWLRTRFQMTHRAVAEGKPYDPSAIISLSRSISAPALAKLCGELSQPTYSLNTIGKIVVDKAPDGTRSPNLADSVMILYGRATRPPMVVSEDALGAI
jgi:phage terminase large subunit